MPKMTEVKSVARRFGMIGGVFVLLTGFVTSLPVSATITGEVTYQGNYAADTEWDTEDGTVDGICTEEVYNPETDEDEEVQTNCGIRDDDEVSSAEPLGFTFNFYGTTYTEAYQNINGVLHFDCPNSRYSNEALPTDFGVCESAPPAVLAFWDDIITAPKNLIDEGGGDWNWDGNYPTILYKTVGNPGSRKFIAQWTNMYLYDNPSIPLGTFQVILYEGSNNVRVQYRNLLGDPDRSSGSSATIGIQGDDANYNQYSFDTADSIHPEMSILYTPDGDGGYNMDDAAAYDAVYLSIPGQPTKPALLTPASAATDVAREPVFRWYQADNTDSYTLTVATDENFADVVYQAVGLKQLSQLAGDTLDPSTTYYWNVKSVNNEGEVLSDTWSFTTGTTVTDTPFMDSSQPNGGDLNNDGIYDGDQLNVRSFLNGITSKYASLEVSDQCSVNQVGMNNEADLASQDSGYNYPNGLMHFDVSCGDPGFTTTVAQYYYDVPASGFALRKYNPNTKVFFTVNGASVQQLTIAGHTVTKATYQVTDGGELDMDDTENGVIVDPAGLANASVGAPNTGLGGGVVWFAKP